jgi:hypothetical protein
MSASSNPIASPRLHKPKSDSPSVSVARLAAIDGEGRPWIAFSDDSDCPLLARHTCAISPADLGREVVLGLEDGDPMKPIILGLLQASVQTTPVQLSVDEQDLTVQAERQITLQCGKASITLTRAGKVLIRGAYVSTRSSGVNRIKGGSVQIN